MRVIHLLLVALVLHVAVAEIEVKSAKRTLDISSQLAKEGVSLLFANKGSSSVDSVQVAFLSERLSYVYVSLKDEELSLSGPTVANKNGVLYNVYDVALKKPLEPEDSVRLETYAVYTQTLFPLPATQSQAQRGTYVHEGLSSFVASPYKVISQRTKVDTSSMIIIDHRAASPSKVEGDTITLGPYSEKAPFTAQEFSCHYENSAPMATYTSLLREIEISHWGNVAVEEHMELRNTGAELDGSFSRLDYQHGVTGNSFEELVMQLPGDATEVYYRDVIGNISTSHVFPDSEGKLRFEYKPRFVMFGGWKTQFYMGYNLPASNYITREGSRYTLAIDFAKDVEDAVIEEMEVRVIFPEGSTDIEIDAPHRIFGTEHGNRKTYLDVEGRPVVSFRSSNLVSDHNDVLRVSYSFSSTRLMWEPLYLILAFFGLCVAAMVAVRVDLSISPESNVAAAVSAADLKRVAELKDAYGQRDDAYKLLASDNGAQAKQAKDLLNAAAGRVQELTKYLEDDELKRITNLIEKREAERAAAQAEIDSVQGKGRKKRSVEEVQEVVAKNREVIQAADAVIWELVNHLD